MKILIRFRGDNDFAHVMRSFGNLLAEVQLKEELMTKPNIVRWFNQVALTLYELHGGRCADELRRTNYLKIEESAVSVGDEEVAKTMFTWPSWGNGDSVLIDFPRHEPKATVTIV